jgi:hypothetical protein
VGFISNKRRPRAIAEFVGARTQSGSPTVNHNIAYPDGTQVGDLLFFFSLAGNLAATARPTPSGWTLITSQISVSNKQTFSLYYRIAESTGGPAAVTINPQFSYDEVILAYRKTTPGAPVIDASAFQSDVQSGVGVNVDTATAPTITATAPALLICGFARSGLTAGDPGASAAVSGGLTQRAFGPNPGQSNELSFADQAVPTGATGPRTATFPVPRRSALLGVSAVIR